MPINKRNAPVPVPSHGISELTRKLASGLCWGCSSCPPLPSLSSCPLSAPALHFLFLPFSLFPFSPPEGEEIQSGDVEPSPLAIPQECSCRSEDGRCGSSSPVLCHRARGDRAGKLLAVVPPWAPRHQPAQPGANAGVEDEQQEGYREFPGCLCCSCTCM